MSLEKKILLVSSSKGRIQLLKEAAIDFEIVGHSSEENAEFEGFLPKQYVCKIAQGKMDSITLPNSNLSEGKQFLALSADTLAFAKTGEILGKPKDKVDAMRMFKVLAQGPVEVWTGCCLKKFRARSGQWITEKTVNFPVCTRVFFIIDEKKIQTYFQMYPNYLNISSSATIDGFGAQFVKWIRGSYTNVLGLPMFEVRQNLAKLGFF